MEQELDINNPFTHEKEPELNVDEFLNNLRNEIKETKNEKIETEQLIRLKEVAAIYSGEDKVISFEEIAEEIKLAPPIVKVSSGIGKLDELFHGGFMSQTVTTISATPKSGKCLAKGTEVLMYDGSLKKVEDIRIGEQVMGEDSKPKNVLALGRGIENMYRINMRGAEYTVNESHILSLKKTGIKNFCRGKRVESHKGEIVNISVKDYLKQNEGFKHHHKGWKAGVSFPRQDVVIEPYFLGLWLGDGTSECVSITNIEPEVELYLQDYAERLGLQLTVAEHGGKRTKTLSITTGKRGNNQNGYNLQKQLRCLDLLDNKHIPKQYLINSEENRLQLLAGLLDTDGCLTKEKYPCYEIIQKSEQLTKDIYYLATSLGFQVVTKKCKKGIRSIGFIGDYFRMRISGDVSRIPVRVARKKTSFSSQKAFMTSKFTVEPVGVGEYYGFELDGNGLFLLGNFVVTHNTSFCMFLTTKFKEQSPLWFALEESTKTLIRKMIKNEQPVPHGYAPAKKKVVTVKWIETKIIESIVKFGTKVVFIDQLDFIVPQDNVGDRHDLKIAKTMRDLHDIAVKWDVAIFLICHLNQIEPTTKPTTRNLRGSTAIWGEADNCIFLWRECAMDNGNVLYSNNLEVSVQANREDGDTGVVQMRFAGGTFEEFEWRTKDEEMESSFNGF